MYGPSHAPGMRQSKLTIWKYFVKKPKNEPHKLWVPNEEEDLDVESLNSSLASDRSSPAAAGVSVMSALAQAIPRLMDDDEGEAAAHDVARLTNNTSMAEDIAAARAGALESLAHILMTGTPAAATSAASALANLVANADSNKMTVCRITGTLAKLISLAREGGVEGAGKGSEAAVRALLNLSSAKEASGMIVAHPGALDAIFAVLSSRRRNARDDAARLINVVVGHGRAGVTAVSSSQDLQGAIAGGGGFRHEDADAAFF